MIRTVQTTDGPITYTLTHKRIKNLNLRLNGAGEVVLSVPMRCPVRTADDLIQEKSAWIISHLNQFEGDGPELLPELDRGNCYELLAQALDRVMPRAEKLGISRPTLKIRKMRSQWGNCHWNQGYITLNVALHRCPEHLRDYVALHELVHFLHHDHGPGFYVAMEMLMPEWRDYRRELRSYTAAILD